MLMLAIDVDGPGVWVGESYVVAQSIRTLASGKVVVNLGIVAPPNVKVVRQELRLKGKRNGADEA